MRTQRQQALRRCPRASATALASLFILFGQVSQLPLPLLLEEAFFWEVVVAAEGQTPQGCLQVPAARGSWGTRGAPVWVFQPADIDDIVGFKWSFLKAVRVRFSDFIFCKAQLVDSYKKAAANESNLKSPKYKNLKWVLRRGSVRTHRLDSPWYCRSCCPGWSHFLSRYHIWSCSVACPPCWSDLRWSMMSGWSLGCWGGRGLAMNADASGSGFSLSGTLALVVVWRNTVT